MPAHAIAVPSEIKYPRCLEQCHFKNMENMFCCQSASGVKVQVDRTKHMLDEATKDISLVRIFMHVFCIPWLLVPHMPNNF